LAPGARVSILVNASHSRAISSTSVVKRFLADGGWDDVTSIDSLARRFEQQSCECRLEPGTRSFLAARLRHQLEAVHDKLGRYPAPDLVFYGLEVFALELADGPRSSSWGPLNKCVVVERSSSIDSRMSRERDACPSSAAACWGSSGGDFLSAVTDDVRLQERASSAMCWRMKRMVESTGSTAQW